MGRERENQVHAENHRQNGNPLDNAALIQLDNAALIQEVVSQPVASQPLDNQPVVSQPLDNQPIAPKQDPAGPVPVPIPILDQLIPDPVSEQLIPDPDFSKAGLIVKLHSDLLNEDFFLVSDGELRARVEAENQGIVAYLPEEIERLAWNLDRRK